MTHNSGGFQYFPWPSMAICRILRLYTLGTGARERDTRVSLARPVLS